ncbi:arginyltransferase [Rhodospirillaceae bacterium KN72]|uniref:Aspartate/glutamate leucyltransferase n=1 Tax=Pacificispira spongiicola TaxID=2729598 RepID=A0A7Y0HDT5_9PROT|nr:arginyltransferase [Pacificispira spongiicola]NMM43985.1 arginyltransferase [Pacificispira spongiicola]
MTLQRPLAPIVFHRSGPMSCPYLGGRIEQQLFMELGGPTAQDTFEHLSQYGFRRSHHIVYRPTCRNCNSCIPVRIPVAAFEEKRRFRKIRNRNADLIRRDVGQIATQEQYRLFHRYVRSRHGDGDMAGMTIRDYSNLVVASPVDTVLLEWRHTDSDQLMATCITDRLRDGYSAVYSFFDPDAERRSLGTHVILSLIDLARERGLPFIYLGFWVPGSPKMHYKAAFQPLEGFRNGCWQPVGTNA